MNALVVDNISKTFITKNKKKFTQFLIPHLLSMRTNLFVFWAPAAEENQLY